MTRQDKTKQDSLFKQEGKRFCGQKQLHNFIMYRVNVCINTTWYK